MKSAHINHKLLSMYIMLYNIILEICNEEQG